jgi:putative endonuclease
MMLTEASAFPPSPQNPDEAKACQGFSFMSYYVYILQSQVNRSFYKGSTNDLVRRFEEHNLGKNKSTSRYLPWYLVWFAEKANKSEAVTLEMKLKNLSIQRTYDFILKYPPTNEIENLKLETVRNMK